MADFHRLVACCFVFIFTVHHVIAQGATDSKKRASEYFCVAQCLGLLNPASPAGPDKSACYEPPVFCANIKFSNTYVCCKDYPIDLFKNPTDIYSKCKDRGFPQSPPARMLQSYVINTVTGNSGKIDLELLARSWGRQLCYMDCAFSESKLLTPDGNIIVDATQKAFSSSSPYNPIIQSAVESCNYNIKLHYGAIPPKMKLTFDMPRECNPLPLLLHQCVRRRILTEPCSNAVHSTAGNNTDCDLITEIRKCDPFKSG